MMDIVTNAVGIMMSGGGSPVGGNSIAEIYANCPVIASAPLFGNYSIKAHKVGHELIGNGTYDTAIYVLTGDMYQPYWHVADIPIYEYQKDKIAFGLYRGDKLICFDANSTDRDYNTVYITYRSSTVFTIYETGQELPYIAGTSTYKPDYKNATLSAGVYTGGQYPVCNATLVVSNPYHSISYAARYNSETHGIDTYISDEKDVQYSQRITGYFYNSIRFAATPLGLNEAYSEYKQYYIDLLEYIRSYNT